MTDTELEAIVAGITDAVLGHVRKELGAVFTKLEAHDKLMPVIGPVGPPGPAGEKGIDGQDGKDGSSVSMDAVALLVEESVRAAVDAAMAALPAPKDGRDGVDGKDGTNGLDGANGKDGSDGLNGKDGADGIQGKDGRDGIDGKDGAAGLNGKDGTDGIHGKDGADGLIGPQGIAGRDGLPGVPGQQGEKGVDGKDGRDGIHGKDGLDGLGFDDFEEEFADDGRTVIHRYRSGERVKEFKHQTALVLDRGVYVEGRQYEKGDGVTWGGSFFIAQKATTAQPGGRGEESRAWRLTVKRGTDGKVGPPGPEGPRGAKGEVVPVSTRY